MRKHRPPPSHSRRPSCDGVAAGGCGPGGGRHRLVRRPGGERRQYLHGARAVNGRQTIQAAINEGPPATRSMWRRDVPRELAGGPLTVNKTLTLLGAQDGVMRGSRRGAESIVNDVQGTSVSASNVVIDGFTVQNSTVAAFTGYGIWLNPGVSGTQILNNIIQNNIVGHRPRQQRRVSGGDPAQPDPQQHAARWRQRVRHLHG